MDVTGAAELYVNRLAREIAPVRLTGNYGSEILRRYVAFRPRPFPAEVLVPEMAPHLKAAEETYAAERRCHPLSFIAFKQVPWHHFARFAAEQTQIKVRSPFLDNDLVQLAFQAPPEATCNVQPSLRLIAEGKPELGRIPTDRGLTYPASSFANRLQRPIHEFFAKAEYAYDYGMPHWLARLDRYLAPLKVERFFLGHQKFCHFRTWYCRTLATSLRDLLPARYPVNPFSTESLVNAHAKGARNYTLEIHKLMTLRLIQRDLMLFNSPPPLGASRGMPGPAVLAACN
jgi:asparagine synthase (glutamine-hydrolysing)